jgi:putative FmdB family regulatory protein
MPIYEYRCQDCGTRFEKLVRNGSTAVACPDCGQEHLDQELSMFAAHANGRAASSPAPMAGGCPSGMCRTPGLCGRN